MDLKRIAVLKINSSYEPIQLCSARDAFRLMAKGAAVMQEVSEYRINRGRIILPSVIRLTRYRHIPRRSRDITRRGILTRDHYACNYCGKIKEGGQLTLDHIIPKSRGGSNSWENLTACCFQCNNRKGDRTPEEAGMPLLRRPLPYSVFSSRFMLREAAVDTPSWQRYLFFENTTPQGETIQ